MAGRGLLLNRFCDIFSLPVEIQSDLAVPDEQPRNRQNQRDHSFHGCVKIAAETRV